MLASFACGAARFVDQPLDGSHAFVREVVDVVEPDRVPPLEFPDLIRASDAIASVGRSDAVIAVVVAGEARAYPLRILVWHEIVNDTLGGMPVAVTYSPLSDSAVAFDRRVGAQTLTFGTSGKLFRASSVLYDRETTSLWPQLAQASAAGRLEGRALARVPATVTSLGAFADAYPAGRVLGNPSFLPSYERTPYPHYESRPGPSRSFFLRRPDRRLPAMTRVAGVADGGRVVAYPTRAVAEAGALNDGALTLFWHPDVRSVLDDAETARSKHAGAVSGFWRSLGGRTLTFDRTSDGMFRDAETGSAWDSLGRAVSGRLTGARLEPAPTTQAFWFAWAAFNPSTVIFGVG